MDVGCAMKHRRAFRNKQGPALGAQYPQAEIQAGR